MARIVELQQKIAELKSEMNKNGKQLVTELFDEFFASHPEALEVRWTQHTPFWNDGDECNFTLGDFCLITQKVLDGVGTDYSDQDLYHEGCSDLSGNVYQDLWAVRHVLEYDDLLDTLLGNYLRVIVRPGQIETSRYERY